MYVEEKKIGRLHWGLVLCVAAIAGLGVWNLGSAARHEPGTLWAAQLTWFGLGCGLVAVSLLFDYRHLRSLAWPLYVATLVMLILVPLTGRIIMGARRWLEIGPLRVQPSEFAKFAVILVLARFFDDHPPEHRVVRRVAPTAHLAVAARHFWMQVTARWRRTLVNPPPRPRGTAARLTGYRLVDLWMPFLLLFVPVVIVIKQPDLGTGLVTTAIGGSIILFAGLTPGTLAVLGASGIAGSVLAWFFALKPYQKDRVRMFIDPEGDALGKGYHSIQSIIAVGSGQAQGKGWGNGTQNKLSFLPEQHTDFAFPVWAEEHGFIGSVLVVLLYMGLVLIALDIAARARDRFGAFICFGAAALFFWHAFINIGMVIGLLPVVGVPLLLFSYGGSSAVLTLLGIGALLNVSMRRLDFSKAG